MKETQLIQNQKLFLPYFLPYVAYTGVATLFEPIGIEWNYGLRIVIVAGLIGWGWKRYVPLSGPGNVAVSVAWGVVAGLAG